ncbi:MAG: sigma-70 family RNA polymerase sigma factor [Flavobacteriales bacterium]|nr:sigma-70 family RNA polymerase sigma factor [Flavobacteriales bacterium]MEB2342031.1 sigma-70 family RNA polymerase sigma factor [Flavobacteriia bacterium]
MAKTIFIDPEIQADWKAGLLANDPKAIRMLYRKHFPAVRQYVLANNGRKADSEDVFQEAVLVLWLKVKEGGFEGHDAGGFLFRVAKNKWLDILRSPSKREMNTLGDNHIELAGNAPEAGNVEDRIVRLREVYGMLDTKCRQVLDLFYFERKSLSVIAGTLGVEEESIRTIKYRCMMKLRACRKAISGENHQGA